MRSQVNITHSAVLTEPLPETMTFDSIQDAFAWAAKLTNETQVTTCQIANDRFKSFWPKGKSKNLFALLGTVASADRKIRSIEPNGKFVVVVGRYHGLVQLTTYYNRYLPYAVAMMASEDGYECMGFDYESVNAIYGTVCGFNDIGFGDHIVDEDRDLYDSIYTASMSVKSPSLPFDEAFNPACVYVALKAPRRFTRRFSKDCWIYDHVRQVAERLDMKLAF